MRLRETATIVGAGIVGLAVARELALRGLKVTVIEKESAIGSHQTGRNSGVIHAGPYYRPGSLKAELCAVGGRALKVYASERGIETHTSGKLIVATRPEHEARLEEIHRRATQSRVSTELVAGKGITDLEPNCVADKGLFVRETGVINYSEVAECFSQDISAMGGKLVLNSAVSAVRNVGKKVVVLHGAREEISDHFINAAGLQSDRIARLSGLNPKIRIIPFRGQYFEISEHKSEIVRGMIYPAPNPEMPFLGVHVTKSLSGLLHAGPNAILAMGREAYSNFGINFKDLSDALLYPGLWKFLFANRAYAIHEGIRIASKRVFAAELSKLVDGIEVNDLIPSPSGIRAQAMTPGGQLIDDFVLERFGRQTHILNAPSPAATASLAIGDRIADLVLAER